jgi:hypothetical protein
MNKKSKWAKIWAIMALLWILIWVIWTWLLVIFSNNKVNDDTQLTPDQLNQLQELIKNSKTQTWETLINTWSIETNTWSIETNTWIININK